MPVADTIVAPASAPGRAALAIVRLSGPEALSVAGALFRPHADGALVPRQARVGEILDRAGQVIDEGVALFWKGPASATGEDLVELSVHGSPTVVDELVAHACARGARVAEAGEFSMRSLKSGKLDLARVEAIGDLLESSTLEQARVAARQLRGEVGEALSPLADALCELLADIEASLDFAEDEGLSLSHASIAARLAELEREIGALVQKGEPALKVREGARVVLVGPPNAGKSSLFNALVGRERVIVSDEPGTTRDTIEETIVLEGLPIVLVDGAGQGEARGLAEKEGMRRAKAEAERADLVLRVFDLRESTQIDPDPEVNTSIYIGTHADVTKKRASGAINVGTPTLLGLDDLRLSIAQRLKAPGARPLESVALATRRHREAAARALAALARAEAATREASGLEYVAVDVRDALHALREIVGEVTPDDLLGRIFARFCIGK